jgi:exopolysaccharide production protein ExoZ
MIGGLQMLRGLAATLVVLFHLQAAAVGEGTSPGVLGLFAGGEAGVDVFFVLSGFVIFDGARGRPDWRAAEFLRQRFWRIVPPYWAALALTLLTMAVLAVTRGDWAEWPGLGRFAVSVLLLPLPDQVMVVAWTLTVEGLFYLLFAATYFRFGPCGAIAALAFWTLLAQGARFLPAGSSPALGLVLYPGAIEFLFGGLIALTFAAGRQGGAVPFVLAGALGLAAAVTGLVPLHWGREWVAGIPSAALVYGLAAGGWRMPGWAMVWGEASYLLYLLHILVLSVAGTLLRLAGVAPSGSVPVLLGLGALAIAVSVATTIYLERPYRRWARGR